MRWTSRAARLLGDAGFVLGVLVVVALVVPAAAVLQLVSPRFRGTEG